MESPANGHPYHQEPFIGSSSTSPNFCYGVVATHSNPWTASNQSTLSTDESSHPMATTNMNSHSIDTMDLQFAQRIKHEELSNVYYSNFTEMLTSSLHSDDCGSSERGFLHHFPSISSPHHRIGVAEATSFDMTLEALDHLGSPQIQTAISGDGYSINHTPLSNQAQPSSFSHKVSSPKDAMEQQKHKKPRVEPRSSLPALKVRREKLGDRIAALQQLVAPFGKTDTASVLMEAIGYIKFLQRQVETLSVLYMKASGPDPTKQGDDKGCELRSRGLCLVPVSWFSCVAETS